MGTQPQFGIAPRLGMAQVVTANAGRDGSGTVVDIFAAGASGSRIDRVRITATGTTTTGMVRLYAYDGANSRLLAESAVAAIVPAATVKAFTDLIELNGLPLPAGYKIRASTEKSETFNVIVEGEDF